MSLSQEWNQGKRIMEHLSDALWRDLRLSYCEDGCVAARFCLSSCAERFWFDPYDYRLYFIATVIPTKWTVPVPMIQLIVKRINRSLPHFAYFTVEPDWGITYHSSISMLPIPEDWQIEVWYGIWNTHIFPVFSHLLVQMFSDLEYCRTMQEGTAFLEKMPGGKVFPSGICHQSNYTRLLNGVF